MKYQFLFDHKAYQKRNLPWLTILLLLSFAVDVVIVNNLRSFEQIASNDSQAFTYGRIGLWFLLLLNTILLKLSTLYTYFHRKKERMQGSVSVLDGSVDHINRVTRYTRLQVILRLGTCLDKEKHFYTVEDRYHILSVDEVNQDRLGNLQINGMIEMQLINDFLDCNPDLDWDSSQKVLLTKHTIPAYYKNMDELYRHIQILGKQET